MSNYFLLRGRRSLLREVGAAWVSLTAGALLFGIVTARLSPAMGQDAAIAASLVLTTPVAAMLLQAIRAGRLAWPQIPKLPVGRPASEEDSDSDFKDIAKFWKSLDPDARLGLRYLAGVLGAKMVSPQLSGLSGKPTLNIKVDEINSIVIDETMLVNGPDEFTVPLKDEKKLALVKIDRKKGIIHLMYLPEEGPSEGA